MGCCDEKLKIERLKVLSHASILTCQSANLLKKTMAVCIFKMKMGYLLPRLMILILRQLLKAQVTWLVNIGKQSWQSKEPECYYGFMSME